MPAATPSSAIATTIEPLRALLPWLREQAKAGSCIATSCTGSFLLAEAGLLDGKVTTTHWRAAQAFRERYPQVVLRESELVTEDGNLVCSGGAVSYIDLAIHLVRRFAGSALALHCARMLVVDPAHRGRGIGPQLVAACLHCAIRDGAPAVGLHTSPIMAPALRLYTRLGFTRDRDLDPIDGVAYCRYVLPAGRFQAALDQLASWPA